MKEGQLTCFELVVNQKSDQFVTVTAINLYSDTQTFKIYVLLFWESTEY